MKKNKAADRQGVVLEMFAYGGDCVVEMMEHFLNNILDTGVVPESWYESFFAMLPKSGDLRDANNWRPVALLSISYKILARIVHKRLQTHRTATVRGPIRIQTEALNCTSPTRLRELGG